MGGYVGDDGSFRDVLRKGLIALFGLDNFREYIERSFTFGMDSVDFILDNSLLEGTFAKYIHRIEFTDFSLERLLNINNISLSGFECLCKDMKIYCDVSMLFYEYRMFNLADTMELVVESCDNIMSDYMSLFITGKVKISFKIDVSDRLDMRFFINHITDVLPLCHSLGHIDGIILGSATHNSLFESHLFELLSSDYLSRVDLVEIDYNTLEKSDEVEDKVNHLVDRLKKSGITSLSNVKLLGISSEVILKDPHFFQGV